MHTTVLNIIWHMFCANKLKKSRYTLVAITISSVFVLFEAENIKSLLAKKILCLTWTQIFLSEKLNIYTSFIVIVQIICFACLDISHFSFLFVRPTLGLSLQGGAAREFPKVSWGNNIFLSLSQKSQKDIYKKVKQKINLT